MGLEIRLEKRRNIPVLKLIGRVIGVDSRKLKKRMESLFKKKLETTIIDITETQFIDSYGLGVIVYYFTLLQKSGRELLLLNDNFNPQSYMTRLLEMTRLNCVFKVITSQDIK